MITYSAHKKYTPTHARILCMFTAQIIIETNFKITLSNDTARAVTRQHQLPGQGGPGYSLSLWCQEGPEATNGGTLTTTRRGRSWRLREHPRRLNSTPEALCCVSFIHVYIHLLSLSLPMSVWLSVCLFVYLSVCLSVYLSACLHLSL